MCKLQYTVVPNHPHLCIKSVRDVQQWIHRLFILRVPNLDLQVQTNMLSRQDNRADNWRSLDTFLVYVRQETCLPDFIFRRTHGCQPVHPQHALLTLCCLHCANLPQCPATTHHTTPLSTAPAYHSIVARCCYEPAIRRGGNMPYGRLVAGCKRPQLLVLILRDMPDSDLFTTAGKNLILAEPTQLLQLRTAAVSA